MIDDGVNDAPALAQADLSFTAAGGADVAGETSDVMLTHMDLTVIPGSSRFRGARSGSSWKTSGGPSPTT